MKKIFVPLLIVVFIFSTCEQGYSDDDINQKGYTIESVEDLYLLCKKAQDEYKDKPDEIGNSVCGAYIQGQVIGFGLGQLAGTGFLEDVNKQFKAFEKLNAYYCHQRDSVNDHIDKFIKWVNQNPSQINSISYAGFWGHVSEGCLKNHQGEK